MNIAIDGHAGSGKSITAKLLAKKLNINVFNTGAIYRAIACEWEKQELGEITLDKVNKFVERLTISVKFIDSIQHSFVNGEDYTEKLNAEKISVLTPKLAVYNNIREKVRVIQREFAQNNDCVMEGRDIGSEILPNADFKFFITAKPEVRANRRFLELRQKEPKLTYEEVLEDLKQRDYLDINREVGALRVVKDSIIVDNSDKNIEETVDFCLKIIAKK